MAIQTLLNKKTICIVFACVFFVLAVTLVVLPTEDGWKGHGTQADPYLINDVEDLAKLANKVNGGKDYAGEYFLLTSDINLDVEPYNIGNGWAPIGQHRNAFGGSFDGNGHIVSGMYINNQHECTGLFGIVIKGEIKNLGVVDADVTGTLFVGGVVGWNDGGTVASCYNTGGVSGTGNGIGGVVGWSMGTVKNCYNTGTITGSDFGVGGVVGTGFLSNTITNCYNIGNINGSELVGGVAGTSNGNLKNCYNTGAVCGDNYVGGVAGFNMDIVENCYNTGSVEETSIAYKPCIGGVVGSNSNGGVLSIIRNCFFLHDGDVNISLHGIGLPSSGSNATPKMYTDMRKESTFTYAGWDFDNVWTIVPGENDGYPIFINSGFNTLD